jgi:hypothetical protein
VMFAKQVDRFGENVMLRWRFRQDRYLSVVYHVAHRQGNLELKAFDLLKLHGRVRLSLFRGTTLSLRGEVNIIYLA